MATKARANPVATTLDLGGAVAAAGGGAKGLYRDGDSKACVRAPRGAASRAALLQGLTPPPPFPPSLFISPHSLPHASHLRRPKSNNIMYDKRVVRGSTYAMPVIPHVRRPAPAARRPRAR